VSSAILYLAIIAIWAGFLVPAWVRRPHAAPAASPGSSESSAGSHEDAGPGEDAAAGFAAGELDVEDVTETENDVAATPAADADAEVSRREPGYRAHEYSDHEYSEQAHGEQEYREHRYSQHGYSEHEYDGEAPGYADEAPGYAGYEDYVPSADADGAATGWQRDAQPSQSRDQMLRARRRMLTILASMTVVTFGFTALGLVNWWICVPPAGMLVLYVLLLREIALADAELARKRATWEAAQASAYEQHLQAQAEHDAYEASLADAGAQIIDISGRVGDQLYDQYADAAVRAVGD